MTNVHHGYGRTRRPKNIAGADAASAKGALGTGANKGAAPTAATHGLATENQRFLHLSLTDAAGGLEVTLYAYNHAFGTWGEFIPVGSAAVATITATGATTHKVFDISGTDRIGFRITDGAWDDNADDFFAAASTF
jgi:hypothetical protein